MTQTSLAITEQSDSRKVTMKEVKTIQISHGGSRALPVDNQKQSASSISSDDVDTLSSLPVATTDLAMEQNQDENYRDIAFYPNGVYEQSAPFQVNNIPSTHDMGLASSRIPSRSLFCVASLDILSGDCSIGDNSTRTFVTLPPTNFHTSRWKLGMSIICVVFAGVAAGVIALIMTMDNSSPSSVPEPTTDEIATAPPDVTDTMYLQLLQTQLLGHDASLLLPNSPQSYALVWMAEIDNSRLELTATNLRQRYALMVLWYTQGGSDWEGPGWAIPGVHECEWMYVNCNVDKEVIGIIKGDGMKMTGSLATEIGMLVELEVIDFNTGRLEGNIPEHIFTLTNLHTIDLSVNKMSSTISASIAKLTQLRVLKINNNFFSGSIPTNVTELLHLQVLQIQNNLFSGRIPSVLSSTLKSFTISSNAFTGNLWTMLSQWPEIQIFDISNTRSFGTIPTEIGRATNLKVIEFFFTGVTGSIPSEIGYLTDLQSFVATKAHLTGTIPSELAHCTELMSLGLSQSALDSTTIPTFVGNLVKLEFLSLTELKLMGTIPTEIGSLLHLTYLELFENLLTGTIPTELATLDPSILLSAYFQRNPYLSGNLPSSFCALNLVVDCNLGCNECESCFCV